MSAINESVNMLKKIIKFDTMTNNQAFDVICKITPAMGRIFSDEEVVKNYLIKLDYEELKREGFSDDEIKVKSAAKGSEMISNLVVLVLEKHRNDVFTIISALNNKTLEEIEHQNPIETFEQTSEFLNHEYLMGFLH